MILNYIIFPYYFYYYHYESNKQFVIVPNYLAIWIQKHLLDFFLKATFFCNLDSIFLNFLSGEQQLLLRFYLKHINTIIPREFLCLVYLCLCVSLGLAMWHLCYLIIFFSIATNNTQKTCMRKANKFQIAKVQPRGVA